MITQIISERAFNELKQSGHCVPRNWDAADSITLFTVGKEYFVRYEGSQERIHIRCTQDCPVHIIRKDIPVSEIYK